jgi:hypothetical protein
MTEMYSPLSQKVEPLYFLKDENRKKYPKKHGFLLKAKRFHKKNLFHNEVGPSRYKFGNFTINKGRKEILKKVNKQKIRNKYLVNNLARTTDRFGKRMTYLKTKMSRSQGAFGAYQVGRLHGSSPSLEEGGELSRRMESAAQAQFEEEESNRHVQYGPYDSGVYDNGSYMYKKKMLSQSGKIRVKNRAKGWKIGANSGVLKRKRKQKKVEFIRGVRDFAEDKGNLAKESGFKTLEGWKNDENLETGKKVVARIKAEEVENEDGIFEVRNIEFDDFEEVAFQKSGEVKDMKGMSETRIMESSSQPLIKTN